MPYSSGTFSRVHDFTDDRDNGIRIQASRMDAEMDGIATGLSTALLKDGTQTATAKIPFAVGLSVIDNQTILLGTNSDIAIQYDETTNDSLEISANVEGAALGIVLKSDQGDDNADQHKLSIADGGTLTLGSKISGSFVSYLTHTPNATVASSTLAVAGNLTVGGNLTLGSGAELSEAELEMLDGITAGTVTASKAVVVDANKDIASFRNITLTGELDAGSLDISGDADIDGTLEADAMTLNGSAITTVATLSTGISNGNLPVFTSGVADDDFLRVNGTAIEGRSASEVLSDIGGQAALTFGISNTNIPIFTSGVADDDFLRVNGTSIEGRSASEVLSDIGASAVAGSSSIVTTGALNAGSITSGFGTIDTGSSNITSSGVGTFGSLDISGDIDVDGTTNLDVVDIDGAVDMASTLQVDGAITSSDGMTITTADNSDTLTLTSTDADPNVGPNLRLYRNSSSPADNDYNGAIQWEWRNDNSQDVVGAEIQSFTRDVTDGTEDNILWFQNMTQGTLTEFLRFDTQSTDQAVVAFNEGGADIDFRVESNSNVNMINVDGGNDRVGIGMIPDTTTLTVNGQVGTTNGSASAPTHTFYGDADTGMFRSGANEIGFANGGATKQRITSTGSLVANGVSASTQSAGAEGHFVSLNDGAKYGMISGCDNIANRDAIVFTNPNGLVGTIKTNGSSTSYNTSSDYRLKENVSYSFDATSRLKQLKPARFNFIADSNTTVDGFLAHEVSSIVPEAISGTKDETKDIGTIKDKDGVVVNENVFESAKEDGQTWEKTGTKNIYQNIDQAKLVPLLVKTIQELEARITALESA